MMMGSFSDSLFGKHPLWGFGGLAAILAVIMAVVVQSTALAQTSITVVPEQGRKLSVSAKNATRVDDSLVLYDEDFGRQTRTNPYGVEVIAVPVDPVNQQYQVQEITSVWECQKATTLDNCGNAVIPENGVVLSAAGNQRQRLLNALSVGEIFSLEEEWFSRSMASVDAINPTALTNPRGSGFPGYRGGHQLLVYDKGYSHPTTGTNEFGFEVTVINGVVVDQEGSDSTIPEEGFVLSGHGKARAWLIRNAPVGAYIMLHEEGDKLTSLINFDTYRYQFRQRLAQSPCEAGTPAEKEACAEILENSREAEKMYLEGQYSPAVALLNHALEKLNRLHWTQYTAFPETTVKGAWHRPVEKNVQEVGQTLDTLKAAGLNSVFLETYFHGYTIFPSQTHRAYGMADHNPKFAGFDVLKAWVEEAHKRDMKVHVWFETFYAGTKVFNPPGPVLAKHPEWANIQYSALTKKPLLPEITSTPLLPSEAVKAEAYQMISPAKPVPSTLENGGYFLDPVNPEVQTFTLKLIEEIITRYDVDGFQLDYIRYPSSFPVDRYSYHKTTWGYTPVARQAFEQRYGADPAMLDPRKDRELWQAWMDFKVEQVDGFVHRATGMMRQKRPDLLVSAAIFPEVDSAIVQKHQNWALWARNGWVDFLAPMTLTSATKVVRENTRLTRQAVSSAVPVMSGVFGPFNNNTAEHVLEQIEAAREAGAKGFVLFDTAHLTGRMLQALQASQAQSSAIHSDPPPNLKSPQ